jgi:predicted DNA-binding antitoxin AbrB/MazE fold protein
VAKKPKQTLSLLRRKGPKGKVILMSYKRSFTNRIKGLRKEIKEYIKKFQEDVNRYAERLA